MVLVEKYAEEPEMRLHKKVKNEDLIKKMMKNVKEGTLQNLLSKIKI